MEGQQGQTSQARENAPDEIAGGNAGQDESTIGNREVNSGGQIRNVPKSKKSETGSRQANQYTASKDPRRQRGAIHQGWTATIVPGKQCPNSEPAPRTWRLMG